MLVKMRIIPVLKVVLVALVMGWLVSIFALRFKLANDAASPARLSLRQVVVITRHGDRSPIHTKIGNSPHCEEMTDRWAFWGDQLPGAEELETLLSLHEPTREVSDKARWPYSQLSTRGANQLKKTGETLRKRYIENEKFLPETLDGGGVILRATSKMRTVQSAQNLMIGLYPPDKRANGTFVPIRVRKPKDENMYPSGCDRERELIRRMGSKGVDDIEKKYGEQFREMCAIEGEIPWSPLRDLMHCRSQYGLPLPPNFGEEHLKALEAFNARRRVVWYSDPDILRLAIGRFLRDMLSAFTNLASDEIAADRRPAFTLFSGHDTTLLPVLAAFGVLKEDKWPDYASYIVIEVYTGTMENKPDNEWVRIFFNDQVLKLPFCNSVEYCSMTDFVTNLSPLIPEDYAAECKNIPIDVK